MNVAEKLDGVLQKLFVRRIRIKKAKLEKIRSQETRTAAQTRELESITRAVKGQKRAIKGQQ